MLYKLLILLMYGTLSTVWAQESVTLPLDEYKSLYRERIEQQLHDQIITEPNPPLLAIDKASYQFNIDKQIARGRIELSGVLIRGEPEALRLFTSELAVTELESVEGGQVISDQEGYRFISDGSERFSVKLLVSLALHEDSQSRYLAFDIPRAVQNSLQITMSDDGRIVEQPGIAVAKGHYFFPPRNRLELRFQQGEASKVKLAPVVDTFTRIEHQDKQLLLTSYFSPFRGNTRSFKIRMPAGAQYLESSLPSSQLKVLKEGHIQVELTQKRTIPFYIRYEFTQQGNAGQYQLTLPDIEHNKGRQGEFVIEQPVDSELRVSADSLNSNLPIARLSAVMRDWAEVHTPYALVKKGTVLHIDIKKYRPVPTPDVVLEALRFFSLFDDSGNVMSTLQIQVPANSSDRLQIKPIPGAELWSVQVNGKPQTLYRLDETMWIIPVPRGQNARVELKFLQKGARLGLKGHVSTMVPETGLTARHVYVAIGLPKRVELVSLDGDVFPASEESWVDNKNFSGRLYFFKRAFYKGQPLDLTVYFKEPINSLEGRL